ncbi:AFG2-interacting ribosome maturation factor [Conger conger]|uniref:AFG2-interacting ribosome maturation factor n=1 Tax=Conger conger TaxID=82655 RepID=UPI002A5A5EE9|nr:AFG2-interacting ribosome maturation factor [Conger conger]
MSKPALLSLHQALKRSFHSLEQNQKVWNSVLEECGPLMGSLCNLAEQLLALNNVQISSTPLARFPNLQDRLRFKLLVAVDTVLEKMAEKMCSLQMVRDAVGNKVTAAFQVYEQHADTLDLSACLQRSAAAPSVADMLEWLQDADRYYRQQYLKRKALLQALKSNDHSDLQSAPKRWEALAMPEEEDSVSDALASVSFFMDSP